jgi:preprotein translocase subunit SecF
VLGVGTLQDLALVQGTGMLAGAVSSIFLATPLLVTFKMRDPAFKAQAARVAARRANLARKAAQAAGDGAEGVASTDEESLEEELRKERAMAAAASVPARTPRGADRARPSGKSARTAGKRRR